MLRLVLPSIKYKKSFLTDFFKNDGEMRWAYSLAGVQKKEIPSRFVEFIKNLRLQSKGIFAKKGLVPQTVYWLVDRNRFLGRLSIRHYLNPHLRRIGGHIGYYIRPNQRGKGYGKLILKLGLKKAKLLGINNVLVTCDITNVKSRKVIESNGGKLENKVKQGKGLPEKLRYWMKT